MSDAKAALVLEDGTAFEGKPFGRAGETVGTAVFYTGVVGYQEVLTDPSYAGALVVLTYPIIGTYGTSPEDDESPGLHARGVVVREYSPTYSNFRATGALEDLLKARGVVGIRDVDTRAVAVHLRERGEMRGAIVSGGFGAGGPAAHARKLLRKAKDKAPAADLVRAVSWAGSHPAAGPEKHRLAALNLGIRRSLLAQLAALGCSVEVLEATAGADQVLAKDPEGVIVAGGPGDPRALGAAVATVKALLGKVPVLGIGLGHQVLALALGCKVKRMKAGHHGLNYPVRDLASGRCDITVQHHSFVVDEPKAGAPAEVTHRNLNDGTVEGIRSREAAAWGVQFHPTPDEMERPSALLVRFSEGAMRAGARRR